MTHIVGKDSPGKTLVLLGNEAIARGVVEAGADVVAAYPGTPASEITNTLSLVARDLGFHVEWSVNEKVAFEVVAGAALVGKRGMTAAKNAGLLWFADMLTTITYGGNRGGLVIVLGDDPQARYSSSEHDSRYMAVDAEILLMEPSNQQEAKDMTRDAFDYSEEFQLPVMVRSISRLSHVSGDVKLGEIKRRKEPPVFDKHWELPYRWNVYGPTKLPNAGVGPDSKHAWIHTRTPLVKKKAEEHPSNVLKLVDKARLGVIASGVAAAYAEESLRKVGATDRVSFLKIGTSHPLPETKVKRLLEDVNELMVIEDGEAVVEYQVRAIASDNHHDVKIHGKLRNPVFRPYGELTYQIVRDALARQLNIDVSISKSRAEAKSEIRQRIVPRSSTFCAGCPHLGTWWSIRMATARAGGVPIVNGDIGCYEQAGYGVFASDFKPSFSTRSVKYKDESLYDYLDTNYIMGGGIGLAQGQYWADYKDGPIVAVAGDSTFFHACMPALVNAVYNKAKIAFIIFDNSWTAMTGHQPHPGTGLTATGTETIALAIENIVKAFGVEYVRIVESYDLRKNVDAVLEAIRYPGPAVVVSKHVCVLHAMRLKQLASHPFYVDKEKCTSCRLCVRLGCPAVTWDEKTKKAGVDSITCIGCGMCGELCPVKAISPVRQKVD